MTTVVLDLSDTIVNQAKKAGVYNERVLIDKLHEFLLLQVRQTNSKTTHGKSSVYDFVMTLPDAEYKDDGLVIQKKFRDEW